jgi:hypothetical protein
MEILQNTPTAFYCWGVRAFERPTATFSICPIEKAVRIAGLESGIFSIRYVAYAPVVDAQKHNGHTNYCLAWALSES